MLKKIAVAELRLGMFLHGLDGPWLDHPFWTTRFVIDDPALLARVHASKVRECWIDVSRGADIAPAARADGVPVPVPAPALPVQLPQDQELARAAAICRRGRAAVQAMFGQARLGKAIDASHCLPLVEQINESVLRNPGALVSLARLKTQDDYTYMHSVAVCALMVALARQLGCDDDGCREAGLAGLLHDLGKAAIPLDVLNKPGRLSEAEMAIMRTHPRRGHEMLQEGRGAGAGALDVCLHHHERPDGRGYPDSIGDAALSRLARMGAVCDVYDAITSNRPYKSGWDPAESIARMASWQGQFDPQVFQAFVRSLGIYPVGSLVKLASGRLAVVVEQNPQALVAPIVKAFFSAKAGMGIAPMRIDLARGTSDRIVGREDRSNWGFAQLDEMCFDGDLTRRMR